jgi:hypothetical protein
MAANRMWARLAPAILAGAWAAPAVAQEFIVSERPALPSPTDLEFSLQGFDIGLGGEGVFTSLSIKPLDGLGGVDPGVFSDERPTAEAVAAVQAEFYGDIKNTSEAIERATIEESICGPFDDSQHVEFYNGSGLVPRPFVDTHEPFTFQLQWSESIGLNDPELNPGTIRGVRWCSGSYIGEERILTAGHCFRPDDGSGSGFVTPFRRTDLLREFLQPAELAPFFFANFKYQIDGQTSVVRTPVRFPIARLLEYRNGGLGYAVVEVGASADGRRIGDVTGPAVLGDPAAYADQSVIAIVQHPNGDPKKVASGRLLKKQAEWLYYDDVDTRGGSSGSAVITADGRLIGVHTNGGCGAMSPTPTGNTRFANAGVSLAAIRIVSAVLTAEAPPPP